MRFITALALLCAFFIAPAEAKRFHLQPAPVDPCFIFCPSAPAPQKPVRKIHHSAPRTHKAAALSSQVVENPTGCPRIAFCGCGAAVRIFGKPIRYLWLAANWLHFQRAAPAPGMAAVSRHHVFVLEQHISGEQWLAYDANSGGHLTRMHVRSIAGYTIVNPHSG